MRIAIIGAGGVGCNVGGPLFEAGEDVTLIDQWPTNVAAINECGLRLGGTVEERVVRVPALHLCDAQAIDVPFDAVFLAVKSYDTEWATMFARPLLRDPDGFIVSFQNGLNEEVIVPLVGAKRTVGAVVTIGGYLLSPANVIRFDATSGYLGVRFKVGEVDGRDTERIADLARTLAPAGETQVTTNLIGERWSKLAMNCMLNGPSALTGFGTGELWRNELTVDVCIHLAAEVIQVARANGYDVEPIASLDPDRFVAAAAGRDRDLRAQMAEIGSKLAAGGGKQARTSALQDVMRGRRTEIQQLNGVAIEYGRRVGIDTPVLERLRAAVVECGIKFAPRPDNIRPVASLVAALAAAASSASSAESAGAN